MGQRAAAQEEIGLTFTAEMEALGIRKGYGLWNVAGGKVSGLELTIFRDAISARVRERTSDPGPHNDLAEAYEPSDQISESMRERLTRAHGIGVTVADILLDEASSSPSGVSQ